MVDDFDDFNRADDDSNDVAEVDIYDDFDGHKFDWMLSIFS